jgi:hypothetical protein
MVQTLSLSTFLHRYNQAGRYELVFGKIRPTVQVSAQNATFVNRLRQALENHLAAEERWRV